jgi:hypothetical protein
VERRLTLRDALWLRRKDEAFDAIARYAVAHGGSLRFALRMRDQAAPDAIYAFTLQGWDGAARSPSLRFAWTCLHGTCLPSMQGTILARHFGPLTSLAVRACVTYDDDLPSRLFCEAVGNRLAHDAFSKVLICLRLALKSAEKNGASPLGTSFQRLRRSEI